MHIFTLDFVTSTKRIYILYEVTNSHIRVPAKVDEWTRVNGRERKTNSQFVLSGFFYFSIHVIRRCRRRRRRCRNFYTFTGV